MYFIECEPNEEAMVQEVVEVEEMVVEEEREEEEGGFVDIDKRVREAITSIASTLASTT